MAKSTVFFIFLIGPCCLLSFSPLLKAQSGALYQADSLFEAKKYTEALKIYESIFSEEEQISKQMLFKMAFIHEGLEQYSESLFYQSLFYQNQPNFETLSHMEQLARQQNLKGYENSDWDIFRAYFSAYFPWISGGIMGLSLIGLMTLIWGERQGWFQTRSAHYLYMFFLLMAFSTLLFVRENRSALISQEQCYLMSAPSAASPVKAIVGKGHKIRILKQEDVWYQFYWENKKVYVHRDNIRLIR